MATDLSRRLIEAAKPKAKPFELRDNMVRGLICVSSRPGCSSWIVERARGQRRTLPQPYPTTTLDAARTQAMALLSGAEPWDRPKAERVLTLLRLPARCLRAVGEGGAQVREGDRGAHRIDLCPISGQAGVSPDDLGGGQVEAGSAQCGH